MEKDVKIGSVGDLKLNFSGGKAIISASASMDGGAVMVGANVTVDAAMLIDQLEKIVEKAVPASAPIDPAIFAVIKSAVLSLE